MNLLKQNPELDRLLEKSCINVFNNGLTESYLIRPCPQGKLDYNHVIYYYNHNAYIITQLEPFRYPGKFVNNK